MSENGAMLEINTQAEIEKIIRQLDTLPNRMKAPDVLASALNATANEMKRKIGQRTRKRYAINDKKILTDKKRGGMYLERAKGSATSATLISSFSRSHTLRAEQGVRHIRHADLQGRHGGGHGIHDQEEHRNHGGHAESAE